MDLYITKIGLFMVYKILELFEIRFSNSLINLSKISKNNKFCTKIIFNSADPFPKVIFSSIKNGLHF